MNVQAYDDSTPIPPWLIGMRIVVALIWLAGGVVLLIRGLTMDQSVAGRVTEIIIGSLLLGMGILRARSIRKVRRFQRFLRNRYPPPSN